MDDVFRVVIPSCGGVQAIGVSKDPRVTASMIWNSGIGSGMGGAMASQGTMADLQTFHGPVAYIIGQVDTGL